MGKQILVNSTRALCAEITVRALLQDVKAERQKAAEIPEEELGADELLIGDASELRETSDGRLILTVGKFGCQYELLDTTAGVRAYVNQYGTKRLWAGFFNMKVIDHYTGAPVAVLVFSASIQEYHKYPDILEMAIENMGEQVPRAVVADRGFAIKSVYEANTKKGIASVIPWRKTSTGPDRELYDTDKYDRHGIPRCKYCGATTRFVRFNKQNPEPRLTVACELGITPNCRDKQQTIYCKVDWRYLLPLWRTTEEYLALRDSHDRYERVHHHWRTRYRVGADDHALRPKRKGVKCQMLRAQAALLIEWLRVAARQGWNGSARRNLREPEAATGGRLDDFLESRRLWNLHMPYGPKAVELGVGEMRPPPPPD